VLIDVDVVTIVLLITKFLPFWSFLAFGARVNLENSQPQIF